jgi:hypothetical protein
MGDDLKVGALVFIRALEVSGVVVGDKNLVRYNAGHRGFIEERFDGADLEPLTERVCEGNHHWDNGGNDPQWCLKCGMSFIRYVHTECP